MSKAGYFLVVRFRIDLQAEAQVLAWLDGGHVAEVLRQPGFLSCRRMRLQPGEYLMLYAIESRAALEAYEANAELKARFARERAPFEKHMRIERFTAEVDKTYEA
jgi:quinol monooxygenase YgiN